MLGRLRALHVGQASRSRSYGRSCSRCPWSNPPAWVAMGSSLRGILCGAFAFARLLGAQPTAVPEHHGQRHHRPTATARAMKPLRGGIRRFVRHSQLSYHGLRSRPSRKRPTGSPVANAPAPPQRRRRARRCGVVTVARTTSFVPRLQAGAVASADAAPHHVLGVVAAGDAVAVSLEVAEAARGVQARDDVAGRVEHLGVRVLLRAAQRGAGAGVDGDGVVGPFFGELVLLGGELAVEAGVLAGVAEGLVLVERGLQRCR